MKCTVRLPVATSKAVSDMLLASFRMEALGRFREQFMRCTFSYPSYGRDSPYGGWMLQGMLFFPQVQSSLRRHGPYFTGRRLARVRALLSLFFWIACLGFNIGTCAAVPQRSASPGLFARLNAHFAIADFDGDQQADLATVQAGAFGFSQTRYWIRFQLTSGERQTFGITGPPGGLELCARDLNGDNFPDVIVSTTWLNRPVAILLNNGHGKFALIDPSEFPNIGCVAGNSWSLRVPLVNENGALPLSRSSHDACQGCGILALRLDLPEILAHGASRAPLSSAFLSPHGRAPPVFIHNV